MIPVRKFTIAATAFAAALAMPASAADTDGRFALRSLATLTCGQVVDTINARQGEDLQKLVDDLSLWLGGYLTHANRITQNTFDVVPFAVERDILAVIVNQCEGLPGDTSFEAATHGVLTSLSPLGVPALSPVLTGDTMIPLRQGIVVRVQERLIALGFLQGNADGIVGERTITAVTDFQKSRSMTVTRRLDIDTVLALLSG